MQVKVGDTVYSSEDQPIMVILTDDDKRNIANMLPECTKYAMFQNDWGDEKAKLSWMDTDCQGER